MFILKVKEKWEKWKVENKGVFVKVNIDQYDIIGVLVIDKDGNMSGVCMISGMVYKVLGWVGDFLIIGVGLYVDNEVGGVCVIGVGELVMIILGFFLVVELM